MRKFKTISLLNVTKFKEKLLSWSQKYDEVFWLDSNADTKNFNQNYSSFDTVLAVNANRKLQCDCKDAFQKLKTFRSEINDYTFGYLGYDLKNDIENLKSKNFDGLKFSDMYFFQPKKIFFLKGNKLNISYLSKYEYEIDNDLKDIQNIDVDYHNISTKIIIQQRISKKNYIKKLVNILDHIQRGDIYEVNFCQEFYAEKTTINPLKVYSDLNKISSPPFATFLKIKDKFLLSASPERFLKRQGVKVISQPIKGTARRLKDLKKDKELAQKLSEDPKERAENIMIVDLVRNDLSKTAINDSVIVEELCKVYTFQQVHQLISTVVSKVSDTTDSVDIIKSLFPMGSMTGAPKISAMNIIEEHEETKRGLYSGAVGYFNPEGDFDFNVVIRSILYNQTNKYISFSVGGAITSQSIIENEYNECMIKANAM
ncbi:MAG: anthranilate synthase component I family protein, partial [Bacteroidota bacterium]